ncbi:hypothetical protein [Natronosalvus vescus]|uniref:hypothetical protein n=1 Tax=Natronosalvus vescus TaxID=2953881 RepID=UPI002090D00F|nr:hypothetical protein [Natronosalvus vescus]
MRQPGVLDADRVVVDLEADPLEQENLTTDEQPDDPATVAVRGRLRDELLEWRETTNDPLLERSILPNGWETVHPRLSDNRNVTRNDGSQ